MAKSARIVLLSVLIFILVLAFFRHTLCRTLIEEVVTSTTGLKLSIKHLNLNILKSSLYLQGVTLFNPLGFEQRNLAKAEEIFIEYDLLDSLKGRLRLALLKIEISEINIIRNEKNSYHTAESEKTKALPKKAENLRSSPAVPTQESNRPGERWRPKFLIDRLELKLGKVTFINYQAKIGEPAVMIVTVKEPSVFNNVSDLNYIVQSVALREKIEHILPKTE